MKAILSLVVLTIVASAVVSDKCSYCPDYFNLITPSPCTVQSEDFCKKYPEYGSYVKKGGVCNFCDACAKYVNLGEDCQQHYDISGLYVKCKDSICDPATQKCVPGTKQPHYCKDYFVVKNKTCVAVTKDSCASQPGYDLFEEHGGYCDYCPACVKYSNVGESCASKMWKQGYWEKCKNSVCNEITSKCVAWRNPDCTP